MNFAAAEAIVRAVLYEGYMLYPYRASSIKNQHRWMFGTLVPEGGEEASAMRTECLLKADETAVLDVRVRFLQPVEVQRKEEATALQESIEREVKLGEELTLGTLCQNPQVLAFEFRGASADQTSTDEKGSTRRAETLQGILRVDAKPVGGGAFRLSVRIENVTSRSEHAGTTLRSFASTHTLLGVTGGEFLSLTDPPDDLREASATCKNLGTWPALVATDTVLSSPIILPDFPTVAAESPGDLFDATEIDEILTLRILTLTDAEKEEVRRQGGPARALLERTEALRSEDLLRLHGVLKRRKAPPVQPGDRVILAPHGRADVFDLALSGRTATVVSIEEDFECQVFVSVTVDDDPGQDLGQTGPGHRFFFRADEVEPLP